MDWPFRTAGLVVLTGCLGDPQFVDCADQPDFEGCGTTTTSTPTTTSTSTSTDSTSTSSTTMDEDSSTTEDDEESSSSTGGTGVLPDEGICWHELSPLIATQRAGEFVVENELFELALTDDVNYMPERLIAKAGAETNLLYTGVAESERYMGVQLWDMSFSYDTGAGAVMPPVAWETSGAVVRFHLDWEAPDTTAAWIASNDWSRYTITPDGRIMRREMVGVYGTPEPGQWLNAYIALNRGVFEGVQVRGVDILEDYDLSVEGMFYPDDMPQDAANLEPVVLCAYDNDDGIAVGIGTDPWPSTADDGSHPPVGEEYAWGLRGSHPTAESIGLQMDWGRDFTASSTRYTTHFMTMVTVAPGDPCGCMHEQFVAYVDPPPLTVMGGQLVSEIKETQEGEGDDQMDGYFSDGGYYAIVSNQNSISVKFEDFTVPTLLLRVTGVGMISSDGFDAHINGVELEEGSDYIATPSTDGLAHGFYFFLARQLTPEDILAIEYEAA